MRIARGMSCTAPGCSEPVRSRGLCAKHYGTAIKSDECGRCGKRKIKKSALCRDCELELRDATAVTEKRCTGCGEMLPIESFAWRPYKDGYKRRSRCTPCESRYSREHRSTNPEVLLRQRESKRRSLARQTPEQKQMASLRYSAKRLGFDPDEIIRRWDAAGHECAICKRPPGTQRLHIDHDHDTGSFRGFLCSQCNTILGMAGDDIERLKAAIKYLRKVRA